MPLKTLTTVRVQPDSPGWYWYRSTPDLEWKPVQVINDQMGTELLVVFLGIQKDGIDEEPYLTPPVKMSEITGEWGDEILPPKKSHAAKREVVGTITTQTSGPRTRNNYVPPPDQPILQPQLDKFLYWIKERHNIWKLRTEGKPKPWTKDTVLQSNFFCNPFRELDKTTVWFRENIRDPLADSPRVLFATMAFRWFNYIPTGQLLLTTIPDMPHPKSRTKTNKDWMLPVDTFGLFTAWDGPAVTKLLHEQKQIFTGAHVIASGHGVSKLDSIANALTEVWNNRKEIYEMLRGHNMQFAHDYLTQLTKVGPFLAYEWVSDLRFTSVILNDDRNHWANAGPGAMRGLNRLYGRPISFQRPSHNWLQDLRDVYAATAQPLLQEKFLVYSEDDNDNLTHHLHINHFPLNTEISTNLPFEMREVEHSLCEFDKYMRLVEPVSDEDYRAGDNPKQSKRKFRGT